MVATGQWGGKIGEREKGRRADVEMFALMGRWWALAGALVHHIADLEHHKKACIRTL